MKTETRNARIVREGMGGFLNPPTHPEHYYSVRGECGYTSLSAAVDAEHVDETTRAKARQLLDAWQPPAIDSPEVQDWIHRVLGYFANSYRGDGPEPECWHAVNLKRANEGSWSNDDHAGVHLIRKYYPGFVPSEEDFARAYWGESKCIKGSVPYLNEVEPVDDETQPS